jgi:hypothetical protein
MEEHAYCRDLLLTCCIATDRVVAVFSTREQCMDPRIAHDVGTVFLQISWAKALCTLSNKNQGALKFVKAASVRTSATVAIINRVVCSCAIFVRLN